MHRSNKTVCKNEAFYFAPRWKMADEWVSMNTDLTQTPRYSEILRMERLK